MRASRLAVALVLAAHCRAVAAEPGVRIVEPWSAIFAGQTAEFHVRAKEGDTENAAVGWRIAVNRRTVDQGKSRVEDAEAAFRARIPPVREGIHMEADLEVRLLDRRGRQRAEAARTLHLFGKNPFEGRRKWLRALDLRLFDPGKDTARLFGEEGVPYSRVPDPRRLDGTDGLLIVGEGRGFQAKSSVLAALADFAKRGGRVLVLAPSAGSMHFPGVGAHAPSRPAVVLRQPDVIRDLDKRVDASGWPPDGQLAVCGFGVHSRHPDAMLSVTRPEEGWPWVSVEYPSGGRMILCAFPIVGTWSNGPNARMLFAAILAEFANPAE